MYFYIKNLRIYIFKWCQLDQRFPNYGPRPLPPLPPGTGAQKKNPGTQKILDCVGAT